MSAPAKYSSPVSLEEQRAGDGAAAIRFVQTRCRVTKSSVGGRARSLIRLRKWQQREFYRLLARDIQTKRFRHRAGVLGLARKNGKSAVGSGLALYVADTSEPGGEVYVCASDRRQAGIVGNAAKAMVRMDPYLSRRFKVYANELVVPATDTRISILSADAATKDGYNPTLVVFDEVHAQPNAELWDAMALGMGARLEPLMIGITTAGKRYDRYGSDTLCYTLYDYGKRVAKGEVVDPTFYFSWWEPSDTKADRFSPQTWSEANPGLGDLVSVEDLESVSRRTDEASFKTKRCNLWVTRAVNAFPDDSFEKLASPTAVGDREPVATSGGKIEVQAEDLADSVLFLDGSWSGDSTGAVGCTRDGHLFVALHYEKTKFDGPGWRVPVNSVKEDLRKLLASGGARVLLLDPFRWQQTASDLADEGYQVVEWTTGSLARIVPAWKDYYGAVLDEELTHDGNLALVRHHNNLVLKVDSKGSRPTKEHPTSVKHIDLAICSVGAYANRGLEVEAPKKRVPWVMSV